jgi:hypothetical protein
MSGEALEWADFAEFQEFAYLVVIFQACVYPRIWTE